MAEWVSHLIVADGVLKRLPMLLRREFCVGNIAPDCNTANADGKTFTPSREITHWMKGERKTSGDARGFFTDYVLKRAKKRAPKEEMSFLIGYYSHLITDAEMQRTIRDPERVAEVWKRIGQNPRLSAMARGMKEDWDSVKRLIKREERMKDWYVLEREYLDAHPDSGYFTEILGLKDFPDYLDYLPRGAIPEKIRRMLYIPTKDKGEFYGICFSKEEYGGFLQRAEDSVVRSVSELAEKVLRQA